MNRRTDIELLRYLAAFGIVYFHSGPPALRYIAYGGLIFFTVTVAFFKSREAKSRQNIAVLSKKLLLPTAIWSSIYLVLYQVATDTPIPNSSHGLILCALATPTPHLWFLPFAFFCSLTLPLLKREQKQLLAAASLSIPLIIDPTVHWPTPFPQYLHALPAVGIGILLYQIKNIITPFKIGSTLLLLVYLSYAFRHSQELLATYITGTLIALPLVYPIKVPSNPLLEKVFQTNFIIYLAHPLFVALVQKFTATSKIAVPILAFLASSATAFAYQQTTFLLSKKTLSTKKIGITPPNK